jgi:hypothetical protein
LIGAYASLAAVVGGSVVVGQAVLALCGRREPSWHSAPLGLAGLLTVAGIAVGAWDGIAPVVAGLGAVVAASVVVLLVRRPPGLARFALGGLPPAGLAVLGASLPFIAAGAVGILGVGLVNDDMASHLLVASWLEERFTPEPVLIDQGYPLGPHALAAGLAEAFGTGLIDAFAGLTLAIPALTALLAFGALERLGPVWRTLAAAVTSLPYLVAAYLAQEAFKEPIMALFVLATALWLPRVEGWRDGVPLGVIAAGAVYVYSFPGLAWIVGTVVVWGAIELVRRRGEAPVPTIARPALVPAAAAVGIALVLVAPDLDRVRDFADFRAIDPDRANEGGLGNLRGHISPLEALGIWPSSEFRLTAGGGGLPAVAFYAGSLLALLALSLGMPRWIRRHGWAVPAALGTAIVIYIGARALGTVYTSAKALAVAAPLITLIALGGLLGGSGGRPGRRPALILAALFLVGAALSTFLVLRQAPVGPEDHMDELAEMRPIVEGEPVLFLGRDNFVLYSLRGSRPFTHVRNFYDPYFVKPNFEIEQVASKFDFDSVTGETLARFAYVITTRAAYGSGPSFGYRPELITESYVLWGRGGRPQDREPVETGPEPSGELRCGPRKPVQSAVMGARPVAVPASAWSSTTIEDGSPATASAELDTGRWFVSLRYDATRPVTLSAEGMEYELPGNLDYRGVAPPWAAGVVEVGRDGPVRFTATVERPPLAGRLLAASSVAHLGQLSFVREGRGTGYLPVEPPYPGAGADLTPFGRACGREADWVVVR